jgi:16S rRNA processing protein RimM
VSPTLAARRRDRRRAAQPEPQYLAVGRVLRPHGVRGELRLELLSDHPTHLSEVETVYIGKDHLPRRLLAFHVHRGVLLITIEGCEDRTEADRWRGAEVAVRLAEAAPLEAGEYYHHQILGLKVISDNDEELGTVAEIIQTGANDVYVVRGEAGEVLLPAIKSVILKIEPPEMIVHVPEGLR